MTMTKDDVKVVVKYKENSYEMTVNVKEKTVGWLKTQLQKLSKIPVVQQELSYRENQQKHVLADNEMPLNIAKDKGDYELTLKNLGKQVSWNTVFYVQYLGPIIILPLFYWLGKQEQYTDIQVVALVLGILHYVKRELETAFVHVFSRESMPFKRVFINSIHYWVFFAVANSIELYVFPSGHTYDRKVIALLVAFWFTFQFFNFKCHQLVSSFRKTPKVKSDSSGYVNAAKVRQIPYGWGFNQISSANYFWQCLSWVTFSLLTRCWTAYAFTILSTYQMLVWAIEKHKHYLKEFGEKYPKGRKAMFPFLI